MQTPADISNEVCQRAIYRKLELDKQIPKVCIWISDLTEMCPELLNVPYITQFLGQCGNIVNDVVQPPAAPGDQPQRIVSLKFNVVYVFRTHIMRSVHTENIETMHDFRESHREQIRKRRQKYEKRRTTSAPSSGSSASSEDDQGPVPSSRRLVERRQTVARQELQLVLENWSWEEQREHSIVNHVVSQ